MPPSRPPPVGLGPPAAVRLTAPARRRAILEAALPVFATYGFAGAGTRDLAKAAAVTEPVLYRHFPSKADLFVATVRLAKDRIASRLDAVVSESASPRGRVEALGQAIEPLVASVSKELRLLHGAAASQAEPRITAAVRHAYSSLVAHLAKAMTGPGLRRGLSPTAAATFLFEVGVGASLFVAVDLPERLRGGYGDMARRLVLGAIADGPTRAT